MPGAAASRAVGGAVRRARVRPAGRGRDRGRAQAGGSHAERGRHLIVAGLHGRAVSRTPGSGRRSRRQPTTSLAARQHRHRTGRAPAGRRARPGRGRTRSCCLSCWPTAPPRLALRTTEALAATASRSRSLRRSRRATARSTTPPSSPGAASSTASRRGVPTRTGPRRRRRCAEKDWKYGFVGTECTECGTRHLPPDGCACKCQAVDRMAPEPLADVPATVATYTIDRLAYSPSPPVVAAVVDFDGGGRFSCELTDVDRDTRHRRPSRDDLPSDGDRGGVHNYFWKARRPVRREVDESWDRHGIRDRSRSWGWAAPPSVSTGTSRRRSPHRVVAGGDGLGGHSPGRRRRVLAGHDGFRRLRAHAVSGRSGSTTSR